MLADPTPLLDALRAAGEPTRFRILALLRQGDLAVGELVQVLEQSQPRLSHHLKALTSVGLVERLPEGSWVFYRASDRDWTGRLLDHVFSELDLNGDLLSADALKLEQVRQLRSKSAEDYFAGIAEDWDRLRGLHYPNVEIEQALLTLAGPGPFDHVIDLGTGTGRMLSLFADRADKLEGLDLSHQMLTVARANLERNGVQHARVRQGDVTRTPFDDHSADLVIVHQVLHYLERPDRVLAEAARILKPGGQMLVVDFARHDLEFLRTEHGHHRLGIRDGDMIQWARQSGLMLEEPLSFDPPATLEQGLSVRIWKALNPAVEYETVA